MIGWRVLATLWPLIGLVLVALAAWALTGEALSRTAFGLIFAAAVLGNYAASRYIPPPERPPGNELPRTYAEYPPPRKVS